jgi:hypothetical protein
MSRSSVPCGRSMDREGIMFPYYFYKKLHQLL